MNEYDFTQSIYTPQLLDEITTAGLPAPLSVETTGTSVQIFYTNPLTDDQQATLSKAVANHVANPYYVTLATQQAVSTLVGYLNNPNVQISNTARAVIVANMASRMPQTMLTTINAQIAAALGG